MNCKGFYTLFLVIGIALAIPRVSQKIVKSPAMGVQGQSGLGDNQILKLDNAFPMSIGEEGPLKQCPEGSYASAFEIKFQEEGHLDETAMNGLKLYCSNPNGTYTGYAYSLEAPFGQWRADIIVCAKGYITGFRANVLAYQGKFIDDVAIENIQIQCNYEDTLIDPFLGPITITNHETRQPRLGNYYYGNWSSVATCERDYVVCGVQTRITPLTFGDNLGLVDLKLKCCENYL